MKKIGLIFCLFLVLALSSCEENPTGVRPLYAITREPLFDIADNLDWRLVTHRYLLYRAHEWNAEQNKFETRDMADAYFYDFRMGFVDAGEVFLNNQLITKTTAEHLLTYEGPLKDQFITGFSYYQPYSIEFNGKEYCWRSTGSKWIDSLSASVVSPDYTIELLNPKPGDIIDVNKGMTVSWKFSKDTIAPVRIQLLTKDVNFIAFTSDSTSFTLSPEDLKNLSGDVKFEIMSGSYKLKTDPDLYYSIAAVYSAWRMPLHLKK